MTQNKINHTTEQYFWKLIHTSSNKFQKLSYEAILSTHQVLHNCFSFLLAESFSSITFDSTLLHWEEFSKNFIVYKNMLP